MLSVLHISAWDNLGGSGRSAYRLHTGLKRMGVRSRMLVSWKATDDPDVGLMNGGWVGRLDKLCGRVVDFASLQYLFYTSSYLLPYRTWFREADVIQLFNTHGGYFSHTALAAISRRRPVVWRLSDMWPMTGHCSYSYECERWKTGCGSCPHLSEYPRLRMDTTALLWRIKRRVYANCRLTIVVPSKWIHRLASESPLLNRFPIHLIPNGIDLEVFRPTPKKSARERVGIDPNSRVVLFSAGSILLHRKGASFLKEALKQLAQQGMQNVIVFIVGEDTDKWNSDISFPVKALGFVHDDQELAQVYSAADLFVLPTLAENFPNGILESMACGTPVVSFNVGGVPEAVRHMETGYLAAYQDAGDMAQGIQLLLGDPDLRLRMSRRCREVAEREYSLDLQSRRFLTLYRDLLGRDERYPQIPGKQ